MEKHTLYDREGDVLSVEYRPMDTMFLESTSGAGADAQNVIIALDVNGVDRLRELCADFAHAPHSCNCRKAYFETMAIERAVAFLRKKASALTDDNAGGPRTRKATEHALRWIAYMLESEINVILRTPAEEPSEP